MRVRTYRFAEQYNNAWVTLHKRSETSKVIPLNDQFVAAVNAAPGARLRPCTGPSGLEMIYDNDEGSTIFDLTV